MEVLNTSGLKALPENKQYSRERSKEFSVRGRVRVQIKDDDGTPLNPELSTSRYRLLLMMLLGTHSFTLVFLLFRRKCDVIYQFEHSETKISD